METPSGNAGPSHAQKEGQAKSELQALASRLQTIGTKVSNALTARHADQEVGEVVKGLADWRAKHGALQPAAAASPDAPAAGQSPPAAPPFRAGVSAGS